jgi:hypothetical protein
MPAREPAVWALSRAQDRCLCRGVPAVRLRVPAPQISRLQKAVATLGGDPKAV